MYGFSDNDKEINDDVELTINIRTSEFNVAESDKRFNEDETYVILIYVLDLIKIRGSLSIDYISEVLKYSSERELLEIYHLQ